jgi:hypothetical protein
MAGFSEEPYRPSLAARTPYELIAVAIKAAEGMITISGLIDSAALPAPAD